MIFKLKFDKILYGVLSGLLLPVMTGLIIFLFTAGGLNLAQYLVKIFLANIITHAISLCVFPNILIFFLFIQFDMLKAARGVLGMTIVWAVTVFIVKII
jgi:hypothetical protein